jgi:hypothetical protein
MYGLFVEHFQEFQTLWNGNGGRVYFYQSEMPYDVPSQSVWMSTPTTNGFASYKVADSVTTHEAWGLGVYHNFRGGAVVADHAFETPVGLESSMHHLTTVFLSGSKGNITHVLNDKGGAPVLDTSGPGGNATLN